MSNQPIDLGRRAAFRSLATAAAAGAGLALVAGPAAAEPQPHMNAALVALRNAESQLMSATHDKGGHRVRALNLVRQAIAEVNRGIVFDNRNPRR